MSHIKWSRRLFLQNVGTGISALPVLGVLPIAAQTSRSRKIATSAPAVTPKRAAQVNVRELGATGDGKTKDTVALQQALDRCAALGGGEVLVPAGDYLTGPLMIRSHTTLRLSDGASLLGSPDIADYSLTQVRWEGRWIRGYRAFISADDAENVTIIGKGKIIASLEIKSRVVHLDGSPIVRTIRLHRGSLPRGLDGPTNVARQDIMRQPRTPRVHALQVCPCPGRLHAGATICGLPIPFTANRSRSRT